MILWQVRSILLLTGISHIGHDKDFLFRPRGFSSVEEHDITILENCNEIVKPEDELWILGDLAMNPQNEKEWDMIFHSINCKNVHYIQGNHDTDYKMDKYDLEYGFIFEGLANVLKYSKKYHFYLSHYPTITGNFDYYKHPVWNLSGHTHQKNKFYDNYQCVYNVALDAHNCYPVSIEQIIKDIEKERAKYTNEK